jgi:hypothetical protein
MERAVKNLFVRLSGFAPVSRYLGSWDGGAVHRESRRAGLVNDYGDVSFKGFCW